MPLPTVTIRNSIFLLSMLRIQFIMIFAFAATKKKRQRMYVIVIFQPITIPFHLYSIVIYPFRLTHPFQYGHVSCNFCPKSFKSHFSLERHLFLLHSPKKNFPCIHCNATCPTKEILDAHLLSHGSGKPFSCSFCGKDFTRKYHLDRHLLYTSCDKSRRKHETACHVCGKLFSRTDNLREHLRAHIGQSTRKRDYQCPHCEKSFYGSSLLK